MELHKGTRRGRAWRLAITGALVALCLTAEAQSRRWSTVTGKSFEAEFVRVEGPNGIFRVKGKESPYPIDQLVPVDRLFINRSAREQANPSSAGTPTPAATVAATAKPEHGSAQLAGETLTPGEATTLDITITDAAQLKAVKAAYGKESTKAKMLIAVPAGFQPTARNYPILVVSATTDVGGSSVNAAGEYQPTATQKGYVLVAVDGEFGGPEKVGDSTGFRWALVAAALDTIYKEWPNARKWPIATAGVSGGGGYASHQALKLLDRNSPTMGLLLMVSGWTPQDFPEEVRRAPRAAVRNLPVFFSTGEQDQVATKKITDEALQNIGRAGFKNVRAEQFGGGHSLHRPHLEAALDWFLEQQRKSSPNSL